MARQSRAQLDEGDERADKICVACGRRIEWRKKWERNWAEVRYCSTACRGGGISPTDEALEAAILGLLDERASGSSICPSEAARVVNPDDWRPLMEQARRAARRLVARNLVNITQKGQPVDASMFKGPIRIRLEDS